MSHLKLIEGSGHNPEREAEGLLVAIDILRAHTDRFDGDYRELYHMIIDVMAGHDHGTQGLIIGDENGFESLTIKPEDTEVRRRRDGQWEVSTGRLAGEVEQLADEQVQGDLSENANF